MHMTHTYQLHCQQGTSGSQQHSHSICHATMWLAVLMQLTRHILWINAPLTTIKATAVCQGTWCFTRPVSGPLSTQLLWTTNSPTTYQQVQQESLLQAAAREP